MTGCVSGICRRAHISPNKGKNLDLWVVARRVRTPGIALEHFGLVFSRKLEIAEVECIGLGFFCPLSAPVHLAGRFRGAKSLGGEAVGVVGRSLSPFESPSRSMDVSTAQGMLHLSWVSEPDRLDFELLCFDFDDISG